MKNITLTCLLILNFVSFGQSNFNIGFKEGFKNGYCYSNNQSGYYCNPPLPPSPPLPQISESSNSYQDGYNRGFLYGQSQRNNSDNNSSSNVSTNYPKFNQYVPQNPVELMAMRGINLQRKIDLRAAWIQNKVDECGALFKRLFINQDFQKTDISEIRNYVKSEHMKFYNSLSGADLSDDDDFNVVITNLNSLIENTYSNYNICVDAENKR